MSYLGFIQSCERYEDVNTCLILGVNTCESCPYGYNLLGKEVDIQIGLDPEVLESRFDKND